MMKCIACQSTNWSFECYIDEVVRKNNVALQPIPFDVVLGESVESTYALLRCDCGEQSYVDVLIKVDISIVDI